MSRWWRAYDEAVDDPKLQRLGPALGWAWFNLMCITSKNGGVLPPIGDVAFKMRTTEQRAAATITALVSAGLFERNGNGQFAPHNWGGRQFQSDVTDATNAVRQKRYRERHRNGVTPVTPSVTVKRPDTEAETDTEAEKEGTRANALAVADDWPADFREQFWQVYPNKVGKPLAIQKLELTRKSHKATWAELSAGLEAYVHKNDDRPWCNPATWINQQRWNDKPATVQKSPRDAQQQRSDDALEQLRAFNRSRGENGGETARLLLEDSGERPEDFHDGDDRIDGELSGLDRLAAR